MNLAWPVRRPLVPVAVAGLAGTFFGLFLSPIPIHWIAVCVGLAALGWWGPKKVRTPAVWLFVTGVFTLYAGARAFAPASDSLR
ncbi:hypothetical protein EBZ02_07915, partial [bacterium]|nr:hypothetical protein [bacterium]